MKEQGFSSTKAFAYIIEVCGQGGKCKRLRQDKVISSFFTINGIIRIKKTEDKPIITYDDDFWQFQNVE